MGIAPGSLSKALPLEHPSSPSSSMDASAKTEEARHADVVFQRVYSWDFKGAFSN